MIQRAIDTIGGICELARLALITRFRFKGPYWRWRLETAFGRGLPESRSELLKSLLHYGAWCYRIRRSR